MIHLRWNVTDDTADLYMPKILVSVVETKLSGVELKVARSPVAIEMV